MHHSLMRSPLTRKRALIKGDLWEIARHNRFREAAEARDKKLMTESIPKYDKKPTYGDALAKLCSDMEEAFIKQVFNL